MFYYSHHIGDFVRDTARLNDAQCMAYLRLIWAYYDTEKPLEADPEKLAFQVGARLEDVRQILNHFFVLQDGVYVHTRCDKEIANFHKKSESAAASANARWKNAKAMRTHSERNANEPKSDANQEPTTNNQQPKIKATVVALPDGFPLETWMAFVDMRKKIKKPMTDHAMKLMIGKLEKMKAAGQDVQAVLEQSITKSWSDVYEVKLANDQFNSPKHQFNSVGNQFNRLDIIHQTTPTPANSDAALRKIIEDDKKASKPNPEVQARIAALLGDKNDKSRSTQNP